MLEYKLFFNYFYAGVRIQFPTNFVPETIWEARERRRKFMTIEIQLPSEEERRAILKIDKIFEDAINRYINKNLPGTERL